jgi:hypothetical protein
MPLRSRKSFVDALLAGRTQWLGGRAQRKKEARPNHAWLPHPVRTKQGHLSLAARTHRAARPGRAGPLSLQCSLGPRVATGPPDHVQTGHLAGRALYEGRSPAGADPSPAVGRQGKWREGRCAREKARPQQQMGLLTHHERQHAVRALRKKVVFHPRSRKYKERLLASSGPLQSKDPAAHTPGGAAAPLKCRPSARGAAPFGGVRTGHAGRAGLGWTEGKVQRGSGWGYEYSAGRPPSRG